MIRKPRPILIRLDHPRFVSFLRHLYIDEDFAPEDLFHVIEKPWRWDEEFREYLKSEAT